MRQLRHQAGHFGVIVDLSLEEARQIVSEDKACAFCDAPGVHLGTIYPFRVGGHLVMANMGMFCLEHKALRVDPFQLGLEGARLSRLHRVMLGRAGWYIMEPVVRLCAGII